jgi:hypothetical protein
MEHERRFTGGVGYFGAVTDDLPPDLKRRAYASGLKLNARQAEALAALLWDGELRGTRYPNVEPPRVAALIPLGDPEALDQPESKQDRRTGEYASEPYPGHEGASLIVEEPPYPASHTVLVVAEDGRMWSIVRAGITWPVPLVEVPE